MHSVLYHWINHIALSKVIPGLLPVLDCDLRDRRRSRVPESARDHLDWCRHMANALQSLSTTNRTKRKWRIVIDVSNFRGEKRICRTSPKFGSKSNFVPFCSKSTFVLIINVPSQSRTNTSDFLDDLLGPKSAGVFFSVLDLAGTLHTVLSTTFWSSKSGPRSGSLPKGGKAWTRCSPASRRNFHRDVRLEQWTGSVYIRVESNL